MRKSILRNLLFSFLSFGLAVALIFPFYANLFVIWKEGMLPWFVLGCVVAGLMIGVMNYVLLNVILLKNLRRISEVSAAVSNKDLTRELSLESQDTVGTIIQSMNAMTANLRALIGGTATLSGTVHESSRGMHEFLNGIQRTVGEQSSRMREVQSAAERLNQTAGKIASHTGEAATKAQETMDMANHGGEVADEAASMMNRMSEGVKQAVATVDSLARNSSRISGVVGTIEDITRQTHILAVNAAIEAARAGEQGRSFAVVAEQVSTLSQRTKTATNEIGALLASVQKQVREALETMHSSSALVESAADKSRESGDSLRRIVSSTASVTGMVQEIATATKAQTQEVQKVNENLSQMSALIGTMLVSAKAGTGRAGELEVLARDLNSSVQEFRIT